MLYWYIWIWHLFQNIPVCVSLTAALVFTIIKQQLPLNLPLTRPIGMHWHRNIGWRMATAYTHTINLEQQAGLVISFISFLETRRCGHKHLDLCANWHDMHTGKFGPGLGYKNSEQGDVFHSWASCSLTTAIYQFRYFEAKSVVMHPFAHCSSQKKKKKKSE